MYTGVENAFLERKVRNLDVEEFQELGVAFQAANGRGKHVDFSVDRKKLGSASHEDDSSTMLAWKVEVKREAAELGHVLFFLCFSSFFFTKPTRARGKNNVQRKKNAGSVSQTN